MRRRRFGPSFRFHLFGTPVRIGLSFPIAIIALPLIFGGRLGHDPVLLAVWLVLVTVSVLVHEGGHVLALRAFGFRPEVSLNAMGGLTSTDDIGTLSPRRSIIVSLAGPLAAISLGITVHMALVPIAGRTIEWIQAASWFVNIWWSAFNLLPIMPLDGGHVMRELVTIASRRRGSAIAWVLSLAVGLTALAWWAFGERHPGWVALAAVLMVATNIRYFAFTARQKKVQTIDMAHEQLMEGDLPDAIATLLPIAWSVDSMLIPDEAYTTLAWALLHERRFHELCYLDDRRFHPNHRGLLVAAGSWYRGDVAGAMSLVADALAESPVDPPDTYFNRVFGRLGELDRLGQRVAQMPGDAAVRAGTRLHSGVAAAATAA